MLYHFIRQLYIYMDYHKFIYIHPLVICYIAMEAMAHRNRLFFSHGFTVLENGGFRNSSQAACRIPTQLVVTAQGPGLTQIEKHPPDAYIDVENPA